VLSQGRCYLMFRNVVKIRSIYSDVSGEIRTQALANHNEI
jgi:hypothetical protein